MADESTFTKEDLMTVVNMGKRMGLRSLKAIRDKVSKQVKLATNPHLRMAKLVKTRYDAFKQADFSDELALQYTSESINKEIEETLIYLRESEQQPKEGEKK